MGCQVLMSIMEKIKEGIERHLQFEYSGSEKVSLERFHFSRD